jgi:hypothetical protein
MAQFARLLAFVLVAAFAAATVAPVADATAMAVQMSLADEGGCGGCPGDDGKLPSCDHACVVSLLALPAASPMVGLTAAADVAAAPADFFAGWAGPPDPSPPKIFLPS